MSGRSSDFSGREWERLERLIDEFEALWRAGERPRIEDYLETLGMHRTALLLELVHIELEFRIKAGEPARVEEYLGRFPELEHDLSVVLGLIKTEWILRARSEPGLNLADYRIRFPNLEHRIQVPTADASTLLDPIRSARREASPLTRIDEILPRVLGKYELRERVGGGSFGTVYRSWDTTLKRHVAIKLSNLDPLATAAERDEILREAKHAIRLRHANIVAIYDAGTIDGVTFLSRAFIEGETLADRLARSRIDLHRAVELVILIASALDHAHEFGIVHRDLKPANILLDREGTPYVADFGLARRVSGDPSTFSFGINEPVYVGTPAYMSPEQSRGEGRTLDGRSDLFSVGVILYELITGKLPFDGHGRLLQIQIERARPKSPRMLDDRVPRALEAVVLKAMAKSPAARYQTGGELADALAGVLDRMDPAPKSLKPTAERLRIAQQRLFASIIAAGLLAAALVLTTTRWLSAERCRAADAVAVESIMGQLRGLMEREVVGGMDGPETYRMIRGLIEQQLEQISKISAVDPALASCRADALLWIAECASARGSDRAAWSAWTRAIEAVEPLAVADPEDPRRRSDLARCHSRIAGAVRSLHGLSASANWGLRARDLWLHHAESIEPVRASKTIELDAWLDRAEAILEARLAASLAGTTPNYSWAKRVPLPTSEYSRLERRHRRKHARQLIDLAAWHREAAQSHEAISGLRNAIRLARTDPADPELVAAEARARGELALASAGAEIEGETMALHRTAGDLYETLASVDPRPTAHRRGLSSSEFQMARIFERRGHTTEAIRGYRRSIALLDPLRAEEPERHGDLADRSRIRHALAMALGRQGRTGIAGSVQILAITDIARALVLAPGESRYASELSDRGRALLKLVQSLPNLDRGARFLIPGWPEQVEPWSFGPPRGKPGFP